MKVSVITCCWNSEPYIDACIRSVAAQTYSDLEHVFVDGGSGDGTLERIQALGGNTRFVTNVRGGISNAMNVGAELSWGEVLVHLHADDYFLGPDVVEMAMKVMQETGALWVFGRIMSDIDGQLIPNSWTMPAYSRRRLIKGNFIAHPALFISKSLFKEAGGFDTTLKYAMDYDLWLRVAALAEPVYLDIDVAAFRRHSGSVSTANAYAAFIEDHQVRRGQIGGNPLARLYHEAIHVWRKKRRFGA